MTRRHGRVKSYLTSAQHLHICYDDTGHQTEESSNMSRAVEQLVMSNSSPHFKIFKEKQNIQFKFHKWLSKMCLMVMTHVLYPAVRTHCRRRKRPELDHTDLEDCQFLIKDFNQATSSYPSLPAPCESAPLEIRKYLR